MNGEYEMKKVVNGMVPLICLLGASVAVVAQEDALVLAPIEVVGVTPLSGGGICG